MAPDPKQKVRSETNSCVHQHLLPVLDQVGAFRTERQQETGFGFSPHASLSCRHADSLEHPERFWVDYLVEAASEADAHKMARELCLEQTVELPDNLVEVKQVEAYTVGSVERIECLSKSPGHDGEGDHLFRVTVAFPNDTCGDELTQFLNVVFGNTSLKQGIAVEHVTLSRHLSENKSMFPGPKFGIQGLRELLGVPKAPLLCTALKPMGRSSHELAGMAYALAKGGIDIIKDDHGLADQVWAPFEERVTLCSAAVTRANQETGRRCLYSPCLNAPSDKFVERAFYSKKVGAGAVMVLPGITGFDAVRQLAASPEFGLPIIIHPALLGGWLQTGNLSQRSMMPEHHEHPRGFSHEFLFGILPRLCGGDAVIFPNAGGRFQFTPQNCQEVAQGCRRPLGRFEPLLPCPAGGMKIERVSEMRKTFGDDTLFLIGGALLEQGLNIEEDARVFAHSAGRDLLSAFPEANLQDSKPSGAISGSTGASSQVASSVEEVERVATAVRRRVLDYTIRNNGGYLSQACSSAETLATLYLRALNLGPSIAPVIPGPFRGSPGPEVETITGEGHNGDFRDPNLDRLIFSPVHYALVLYSLLVEIGRLDVKAFESYNKDGSTVELIGAEHSPGHAVTAGSLAQALSQAAGIAYARKLKGHTGRVCVYMSDGEFQEGQTWEAIQAAVFHKISNLTAVVDVNGQQCDGKMESVCNIGSLARKLHAFGATVFEVDGHSVVAIEKAVKSHSTTGPTFVLCFTDPCRGFPLLRERAPNLHYVRFKGEAERSAWSKLLETMMDMPNRIETTEQLEDVEAGISVSSKNSKPIKTTTSKEPTVARVDHSVHARHIETASRPHRSHLLEWARAHPQVIVLTADLTSSCEADLLRDTLPGQYLSMGMAEQNMMSFAGGLAREGYHPYVHTFGVFVTRRPFDQVAMSIGVPNLPVRLLGFLPGLTTPGGVTHQAIDDVSLMRSIPNMRILECGDATEVESVLDIAEAIDGPVYIRMLRGEIPRLFPKSSPMQFGTVRVLSEGVDVALVTAGICTEEATRTLNLIGTSAGVSIRHLHLSTIVPFPTKVIAESANAVTYGTITMENHSIIGGIGSATAEVMAEYGIGKPLIRLGVPGIYAHGASRDHLIQEYGLDSRALIQAIEKLTSKTLFVACSKGQQAEKSDEGGAAKRKSSDILSHSEKRHCEDL